MLNRQKSFENGRPTLYLVATPIGNLDEMTYRSINTLKNVKYIAAEDTRNTVKLLNHFEISTKLISHHKHNIKQSIPKLIQLLEEGKTLDEVIKELNIIKEKYCLVFSIDSLNHLQKGGRISSTKAMVGNLLNVKPICEVKDGLVTQLGQVRGKKNVINKLIEATDELTGGNIDTSIMYIGYMDNEKEKDKMVEALKEKYNPDKIGTFKIGSCIGSHSGPGVLGILSFKK